ncbi:MAG: chemotaxis protein CheX [Fibrobacterota bacterium]
MALPLVEMLKEAATLTFRKALMVDLIVVEGEVPEPEWEVFGLIGLSGDVNGNVALCLRHETAREIIFRFSGEESQGLPDITDAVGELVNIIAGNAKSYLSDKNIFLSLPEVIQGKSVTLDFKKYRERVEIRFASDIGPMKIIFVCK